LTNKINIKIFITYRQLKYIQCNIHLNGIWSKIQLNWELSQKSRYNNQMWVRKRSLWWWRWIIYITILRYFRSVRKTVNM